MKRVLHLFEDTFVDFKFFAMDYANFASFAMSPGRGHAPVSGNIAPSVDAGSSISIFF